MKRIIKTAEKICKVLLIFMLSISQFSFPLEVLADELNNELEETVQEGLTENESILEIDMQNTEQQEEEVTESKYQLLINEEEVTEYTLKESDNKVVNIIQNYDGEEGTYEFTNVTDEIDFTNKLYGDYEYTYSVKSIPEHEELESKTILIHYEGDNSEILSSYTELKYIEGTYYVKGKSELLKVEEVLANFKLDELEDDYFAKIKMVDAEGNQLELTDEVIAGDKLVLIDDEDIERGTYLLAIEGDYTDDSLVNEEDAKALIDKILNDETNSLNEDQPFNILDATNPVFTTGSWENNSTAQDTLTPTLENVSAITLGQTLTVKFCLEGFEFDSLTGFQGKINYNKEILKLTNIEIDSLYGNYNEDGKFAYLLDNYHTNGVLMTLTFDSIATGDTEISIDEMIASTGVVAGLIVDSWKTSVTVLEDKEITPEEEENFGTGGDEGVTPETTPEPESTPVVEVPQQTVSVPKSTTTVKRVTLSSDCHIKSLTIKGQNIKFNKDTYEYSIKVKNSVKSLDLNIELNDEKASYTVTGNENFKVGENTVTITVTAENGDTKTYTIKVNREEKEEETTEEEEVEEKNSSKTIIIILIVLVIIGLIYVIFKDDEEDNKESKK